MAGELTQDDRYPWLTDDSRRLLAWLHEHPAAPQFNHECGDRLTAAGLERVRQFEQLISTTSPGWLPDQPPPWLADFVAFCFREVPVYRRYGAAPARFADVPTCARADISREPWHFVPDSFLLDDLIVYNTSGITGHPLEVLSPPQTASTHLPFPPAALPPHG